MYGIQVLCMDVYIRMYAVCVSSCLSNRNVDHAWKGKEGCTNPHQAAGRLLSFVAPSLSETLRWHKSTFSTRAIYSSLRFCVDPACILSSLGRVWPSGPLSRKIFNYHRGIYHVFFFLTPTNGAPSTKPSTSGISWGDGRG